MTKIFLSLLMFATVSPAFASIADDLAQLQGKSALVQFHERLLGTWVEGESVMIYELEQDGDYHIGGELVSTDEDGTKYYGLLDGTIRIVGNDLFYVRLEANGSETLDQPTIVAVSPSDLETRTDYSDGSYWNSRAEFLDENTFIVSGEYYKKNQAGEYVLTETAKRTVYKRQQ